MRRDLYLPMVATLTAAVVLWLTAPATAVVNQIDGQIVPVLKGTPCPGAVDQCVQTALNLGEGHNPPNVTPSTKVDAVMDAQPGPGTFIVPTLPSLKFSNVTFKLLQEGAGYENIFGWYNVGSPGVRYPVILSCAFGKKTGTGSYEPPAYSGQYLVGGYTASVDFQSEFTKGRYKGGLIGFYLISPEGSNNENLPSNNYRSLCATDPADEYYGVNNGVDDDNSGSSTDDAAGFGRVYYTEAKLNNDGNYVHYLIYQSKADKLDYYFAFEDLFRGGDNDFDDTLVKVEGLKVNCVPAQEVCNDRDDNCDGLVDENMFQDCYSAKDPKTAGVGQCKKGKHSCIKGTFTGACVGEVIPTTEKCDTLDNDCNGIIDDNLGVLPPCTLGGCQGTMVCVKGKMVCAAPKPSSEICDGKDNDCNGNTDENLSRMCSSKCGPGVEACKYVSGTPDAAANWTGCTAASPTGETCDGVDNDCNGVVDDGVSGTGLPCDDPSGKTCAKGKTACVGGKISCVGATPGLPEVCDCKDNDCNGQMDEGNPCPTGTKCVKCGCRISCTGQEFGCPKGFACSDGYCVPDNCANVTCAANEKCQGGKCVPLCSGINCGPGQVCQNGFCVEDSCYGTGCPPGKLCYDKTCIDHPCAGVTCAAGQFCEKGTCKPSCGQALCGELGLCRYGECVENPCARKVCDNAAPCHDGKCDTACTGVNCGRHRICRDGKCVDDPCRVAKCYGDGEVCKAGQCITPGYTYNGEVVEALATGGGFGCELPGRPGSPPPLHLTFWLLLAALFITARRTSR